MSDLTRTSYGPEIKAAADAEGLPDWLVEAIVLVESSGLTSAFRFKPQFWARYRLGQHEVYGKMVPLRVSSSYGLMQVMYVVAYELGYTGPPEGLFVPEIGLKWGCAKLRSNLDWAKAQTDDEERAMWCAVAAYNGGRGGNRPTDVPLRSEQYVRKVQAKIAKAAYRDELG